MSETPRTHSEQAKKKIGSALKQLWAKRLKLRRSKEKFYYSWEESIAEAAKKGGMDEEQLCWDSYEIQKNEIACRPRQLNKKKAKEMVIQGIQPAKRPRGRPQNKALLAENKLDHRQHEDEPRAKKKVRARGRPHNKALLAENKLDHRQHEDEPRAKKKVTRRRKTSKLSLKIKEEKPVEESFHFRSRVMSDLHSALEKLNIGSIKEEQKRRTISLADQIQAAKSRRQEVVTRGSSVQIV